MYSQLIYFLVALVLFTLQQPGARPLLPLSATIAAAALFFLLYALICRFFLQRLQRSSRLVSHSNLSHQYHRLQNRLSILALAFVAIYIYILNIKFYLQVIPGLAESLTISGITGIGLFLMHLALIWFWSHPLYRQIYHSDISLTAFLRAHIAFVSAILIPWLLISTASDLLQIAKLPAFLTGDLGQFVLLGSMLLVFVLFAPWLVIRLWGCKPLPPDYKREELESFCRQNNFRVGGFMLWPLFGDEMLTAGVIGILPRWRYILITKGLMSLLDTDELKAVVAHEMGHVRRLHVFIYLIFFIGYSVLAYSFHDVIFLSLLRNELFLQWATAADSVQLTLFSIVYTTPILLLLLLYFRYIFGFFMRNSERQADLYALGLLGSPSTLISSLQKIAFHSGQIEDLPSWHHFSIRQRIDFLVRSYRQPVLIRSHDRKLYGSILLFFALIIGFSFLGFQLQNTRAVKQWKLQIQTEMLEKQIQRTSADPELYAAYAGLLLDSQRYETALSLLIKAVAMAPKNATVLNNLAWLYATAPAPYFDPGKALKLALEAAALESQPYILDTLAEAYYANNRYQEAHAAIQKALAKEPQNRDYFLKQLEKFERAARTEKAGVK